MISEDRILEILEEIGGSLGTRPPAQLKQFPDGTLRFVHSDGLTINGARMIDFARAIEKEVLKTANPQEVG